MDRIDFVIRAWSLSDLDSLLRYANNWNIAKNMTDKFPYPYTDADGRSFIEFANRDNPIHLFTIDINGDAVGGIGIHPQEDVFRRNAELGYWLGESYWSQGIMTNAVIQMVEFAFKKFDIDRVFARPFGANAASQKVLEKVGFTLEGKFEKVLYKNGKYHDELIYSIRK